jgi:hypothetical protein
MVVAAVFVAMGVGVTTLPADAGSDAVASASATAAAVKSVPPVSPATVAALAARRGDKVTWPSGTYSGLSRGETTEFARWRGGRSALAVTQFQQSGSRADMANVDGVAYQYAGLASRLVLSTAFWPQNEKGSLALAGKGAYNDVYRNLGKNLVAKGLAYTTLRPGWEFNGDWMPWKVLNRTDARSFQYAWINMVRTMRAVPGSHFTFDWAPVAINGLLNPEYSWPGSAYVDFVGLSVYNYTPKALQTAPAKRFQQLLTWRYGLNWQYRFAVNHRKRVTYPEWAQVNRPFSPAVSSGDDNYFVYYMWSWMRKAKPAYEMYFDVDTLDFTFYGVATGNGVNPKTGAMYRQLWARPAA